jgi:hypothetical protein
MGSDPTRGLGVFLLLSWDCVVLGLSLSLYIYEEALRQADLRPKGTADSV